MSFQVLSFWLSKGTDIWWRMRWINVFDLIFDSGRIEIRKQSSWYSRFAWHCFHIMKIIEEMINKKFLLLHSCCVLVSTKNQENQKNMKKELNLRKHKQQLNN
jgi:hypothetical protein